MPIYEYQCEQCSTSFEVMQKMSDDPLEECERCGGHLRKVLHPVAIHFKGSGFYTTDYGRGSGRRSGARDGGEAAASTGAGGGERSRSETAGSSKPDAKGREAKAAT